MRSLVDVLASLGSPGAFRNAQAELDLAQSRRAQASLLARRVDTIDAVAGRRAPREVAVHRAA